MMHAGLKTSTGRVGPVVVCSFVGDMLMDNEAIAARTLDEALGRGPAVLAVDMSGVELFTSSGLNALLAARLTAAARGVPVVLIAPSPGVRRVLELTEADSLFPVVATAVQAARVHAPTIGHDHSQPGPGKVEAV
ncbi:STAS domain-containing protein [Kitasatospora sp. NPDC085464]|uniref:STAS domain-containing protein n=1 Tax=Kitasatospora sp. NPDC085464 TaxID=3364063 RepID=UPI0037C835C6